MNSGFARVLSPGDLSPSDIRRFWGKVNSAGGAVSCWPWMAGCDKDGYGKFQIGPNGRQRHLRASRVALVLSTGQASRSALHRCRNRKCCNPRHLFEGVAADSRHERPAGDRNGRRLHPERYPKGERHWNAALNADTVRAIRAEAHVGKYGEAVRVARKYQVPISAVRQMLSGRTWRHVQAA